MRWSLTPGFVSLALALGSPTPVAAAPLTVKLPARSVHFELAEDAKPLGLVYAASFRTLRRAELEGLRDRGARYMGMLAARVYAFELTRETGAQILRDLDLSLELAQPNDKLGPALALMVDRGVDREERGLTVAFWPHATRQELTELVGLPDGMRLPATESGRLGVESVAVIEPEAARWLDLDQLLASPAVATVDVELPRSLTNDGSLELARSDLIQTDPFELTGEGVLVGHWDGGSVDDEHPDFGDRVTNLTNAGVSSHATHTAGTVLGAGVDRASARGHAPSAQMVALTFNGNPTAERREVKHLYYHHHDNHSWGVNSDIVDNFGTYNRVALEFDIDSRDLLLLPVKAAGNDGQASERIVDNFGFDSLSPDSTAKNSMVVGATSSNGNLTGFSSRGPTEDGRLKPDVVAVGAGVISTAPGGGYFRSQGTSMSAPGVTGILALLAELFERDSSGRRMHPDVARGLLIHTAVDVYLEGPDFRYGWGIADALAAAELIEADRRSGGRQIVRGAVRDGEIARYTMEVPESLEELKITLSWLDAFFNAPSQRRLLNDIDLVLVAPSGERLLPFAPDATQLTVAAPTGRNSLDNVEQVRIAGPEAGLWTIEVAGTDVSDPDLFVQGFVLVTDLPVERNLLRVTAPGAAVPDGEGSLVLSFDVSAQSEVNAVRVFLDLKHEARGQVRIELVHPSGDRVVLETEDTSTRRDIYAIYPDLRSYDEDVTSFHGRSGAGTWRLEIQDLETGETGEVRHAELELDFGPNRAPVASIDAVAEAFPGDEVRLDGSGSSDPDGDPLSFSWSSTLELGDASAPSVSLVVPEDAAGTELVFVLTVDDGRGGVASAEHLLSVLVPNRPPVIELEGPAAGLPGQTLSFDASASSDEDGDPLSFTWVQVDGPSAQLRTSGARLSFDVPEAEGGEQLQLQLSVSDGIDAVERAFTVEVVEGSGEEGPADGAAPPSAPIINSFAEPDGCTHTSASGLAPWISLLGLAFVLRRRRT